MSIRPLLPRLALAVTASLATLVRAIRKPFKWIEAEEVRVS
jgi:hypothetical protein